MNRLAYLTAMALLGIGLTLAQNTSPSSDQSNSSNSAQTQSGTTADQTTGNVPRHHADRKGAASQSSVPDPTVKDEQSSTTATTGASGQSDRQASGSTMGTTGNTPEAEGEKQQVSPGARQPENGQPADQQPNPSSNPSAAPPHAELLQTPAARAVATHTPDPGTCMNPAALQTAADGSQPSPPAPCH